MTAKHLEKWWIEWDPTNNWVQVIGKVQNESGSWDIWQTSPIETAYGPKTVETSFKTKYTLGEPSNNLEKWLIPENLKSVLRNGFTKNWVELFEKSRITRSTPHKKRPKTKIDELAEVEENPILVRHVVQDRNEDQAFVSQSSIVPSKPAKKTRKKQTFNVVDPLEACTQNNEKAKINYYVGSPEKPKNKRKSRPKSKVRKPKIDIVNVSEATPESLFSETRKQTKKQMEPKRGRTKQKAEKSPTPAEKSKRSKSAPKRCRSVSKATGKTKLPTSKSPKKSKRSVAVPKKTKTRKNAKQCPEPVPSSPPESPQLPTPHLKPRKNAKQKSQAARIAEVKEIRKLDEVSHQAFDTPRRVKRAEHDPFATPAHSKAGSDFGFQTPANLPGKSSDNIGFTTPSEFISKKGKKRALRTPKANEGLIKKRVANEDRNKRKKLDENIRNKKGTGLLTPEAKNSKKGRAPLRPTENIPNDLDISLPNLNTSENDQEEYFNEL